MYITRHEHPDSPLHPDFALIEREARWWREVVIGLLGDDDLAHGPLSLWGEGLRPAYFRYERFVARDAAGTPIGIGTMSTPQRENVHLAEVGVIVDPAHRRQGVGSALIDAMLAAARADGRRTVHCATWEPLVPSGERVLRGVTGDGTLDRDAESVRFALSHGFRLVQVETMSGLDLATPDVLSLAAEQAAALVPDYETVTWRGVTPEELRPDMADLHAAMSSDVPMGDADVEASTADPDRVRDGDEAFQRAGIDQLFTVVRHVTSGRLVAFTRLMHEPGRTVANQWETLVLAEHRGHGLGWLAKTHNHSAVPGAWPQVRRLVTGNASENDYMLNINRRLGYRPIAASGWFELRMDD